MPNADEVTIEVVGGPSITIKLEDKMNAQQAMEKAWEKLHDETIFTYSLQYFGKLGYLVTMINETYETFPNFSNKAAAPFYYWEIFVNGDAADKGIDNIPLKGGETISFELKPYPSDIPASSTIHAKHKARLREAQPDTATAAH